MSFHHDYETFSTVPIKSGVHKYATGADILMLGYWSERDQRVKVWVPPHLGAFANVDGDESEIIDNLDRRQLKYAHNANFERTITEQVAARDFGWPVPPVSDYRCTAAMCAALSLQRSLEKAATALRLPVNKDKRGKDLIKMFCLPQIPTAKNGHRVRVYPADNPNAFMEFIEYCRQDVITEMALHARLARFELSPFEQRIWQLDSDFNALGLPIDVDLTRKALSIVTEYSRRLAKRFKALTGVNPTQRDKALLWAVGEGFPYDNLQAGTLDSWLANDTEATPLHEAMAIRRSISRSSTKKLQVLLDAVVDGRVKDTLLYHGAHTGRWSGKTFQPQNLPRPTIKDVPTALEAITTGDLGVVEAMYDDPLEVVSSCLRGLIKASPGKRLIVADYSSIEARVLCWIAGQTDILAGYAKNFDAYIDMATTVYRVRYDEVTDDQRRTGKAIILGSGFGMSGKTFHKTCLKNGLELTPEFAQQCVDTFRAKYDKVPSFWYALEAAAISAVKTKTVKTLANDLIKIAVVDDFLFIRLPSGRKLAYPYPRVIQTDSPWGMKDTLVYLGPLPNTVVWSESSPTYSGRLAENLVQAIARDLMAYGMHCAHKAGYQILTTIHDEVVSEVPLNFGSVSEFEQIISTLPAWANGLPLAAKGYAADRYQKG